MPLEAPNLNFRALAMLGLPLAPLTTDAALPGAFKPTRGDLFRALAYAVQNPPSKGGREAKALYSLVAALHRHFPSVFRELPGWIQESPMISEASRWATPKLTRISAGILARYL